MQTWKMMIESTDDETQKGLRYVLIFAAGYFSGAALAFAYLAYFRP